MYMHVILILYAYAMFRVVGATQILCQFFYYIKSVNQVLILCNKIINIINNSTCIKLFADPSEYPWKSELHVNL